MEHIPEDVRIIMDMLCGKGNTKYDLRLTNKHRFVLTLNLCQPTTLDRSTTDTTQTVFPVLNTPAGKVRDQTRLKKRIIPQATPQTSPILNSSETSPHCVKRSIWVCANI